MPRHWASPGTYRGRIHIERAFEPRSYAELAADQVDQESEDFAKRVIAALGRYVLATFIVGTVWFFLVFSFASTNP